MIYKIYGKYTVECDECGILAENFETFGEAIDFVEKEWAAKRVDGHWEHFCDECKGEEDDTI